MKLFSGVIGAAVIATSLVFSSSAFAGGADLFKSKGCAGCHGPTGMGAVGPRLAGQMEAYIVEQFKLIRDGKRASGKSGMMAGAVKGVSDGDAAAIASYLAGLK